MVKKRYAAFVLARLPEAWGMFASGWAKKSAAMVRSRWFNRRSGNDAIPNSSSVQS
jgi:hypothetical protein